MLEFLSDALKGFNEPINMPFGVDKHSKINKYTRKTFERHFKDLKNVY